MSTNDREQTRAQVSETYTKALTSGTGSCCAPPSASGAFAGGCCGPAPEVQPKGSIARVAGYGTTELGGLPDDAVVNSFGCGNPLAFSGVEPGQTVLDLGAGAGIDVILAAQRVGPTGQVIGVDMTDAMIARATDNIRAAGLDNAEIRQGIIEELPLEDGTVDWVISNCVINLSPEKPRVFAEIARVLAPGGQISISDIVVQELPTWARESQALYGACVAGAISEADYLQGLRDAGLIDVEVTERMVYDASQVRGFLSSEEAVTEVGELDEAQIEKIVAEMTGKVWSAKFVGRRGQ